MNLKYFVIKLFGMALLVQGGTAWAVNTLLSGEFDGSEPVTAQLPGNCGGSGVLAYQVTAPWQVTASGRYTVTDANSFTVVDVTALVYRGTFDPDAPLANLETPAGVDVADVADLSAGVSYVLVVQTWCADREGTWTVTFSGPGSVNSVAAVNPPEWTAGEFTASDPQTVSACGSSQYRQTGPLRVSRDGTYYYWDVSEYFDVDMCLQIYSAPFDPANPAANRVGDAMDFFGTVELEAGRDYWFVTQPLDLAQEGEFFYVFAPPAPFRINHALAGGWFYPPTSGQGFLLDVFDTRNELFVAWFTYDLLRPDEGVSALIGDPGHRWLTAQGPFSGNRAELPIYWSRGMIFDSPTPAVEVESDGSMSIEFYDCHEGLVSYDLGSAGVRGEVPIQRLADDAAALCESLIAGPGKPGSL
jgi:hypothetical protein